jgi:hypothetical protein
MNINNKAELLKALDILRTIAQDPEINAALWEAGVLDAILAVWRKHQKDPRSSTPASRPSSSCW